MLNVLLWGPPSGQGVQTAVCVQSELWSVFVRHCYNQRAQHHCYHQRSVAAGCVFYAKAVLRFWTNIQVFYNLGCVLFIYFFWLARAQLVLVLLWTLSALNWFWIPKEWTSVLLHSPSQRLKHMWVHLNNIFIPVEWSLSLLHTGEDRKLSTNSVTV